MAMMYSILAQYYQDLVNDPQSIAEYVDFIAPFVSGKTSGIDFGCGTGQITQAIACLGLTMDGVDLSLDMINCGITQYPDIHFIQGNMVDVALDKTYDCAFCLVDTLNYLLDEADVIRFIQHVYDHLNPKGIFILDAHHPNRLNEFKEPFIEEGWVDGVGYQWTIATDGDYLNHHFAFYTDHGLINESHIQRVYDGKWLNQVLTDVGFTTTTYYDFQSNPSLDCEKYDFIGVKS